MSRRVIVIALLVVLAGCSGLTDRPTPQSPERELSVSVSNDHDDPYRIRVTVVPPTVDGLEVTYENGSTRLFDVSSVDALPQGATRNATAISPTDGDGQSWAATVQPGTGLGTTIERIPANATVVYFVVPTRTSPQVRGAGVVRCSADTESTHLSLQIRPDGSLHSAVLCTDDPDGEDDARLVQVPSSPVGSLTARS
jgi:hypothetical protein